MELFGLEIRKKQVSSLAPIRSSNWFSIIRESFSGAWQRNVQVEATENLLAFSAVFACVSLISDDISKLRPKLMQYEDDIWDEVEVSPFLPVLRKPNPYQTRIQFLSYWMVSKLLYGNTYVLKQRDNRNLVTQLYVLDPRMVVPLTTPDGDIYYQINRDPLSEVLLPVTVPASAIIHDRMLTLWHPLIGVSPISACGTSATQGIRIQNNSATFFENMSRPSGQLTAPGPISDDNAKRLKQEFERNFSASNIGRLLVTGDGLKYEPMAIPATDAQLIEQLRWTVEDVARCFKVPLHKLGMGQPTLNNIGALNQDYYSQCLQSQIEAIEVLLDEGLSLPSDYGVELDLECLLRMDPISRADRYAKQIGAGMMSPNEARELENLEPVVGGETPYLQQQNYSLSALAKRDTQADPFAPTTSTAPPPAASVPAESAPAASEADTADAEMAAFGDLLIAKFTERAAYHARL